MTWGPVLAALSAALLLIIPAAAYCLKTYLDKQTAQLQSNINDSKRITAQNAESIVTTVEAGHRSIVNAIKSNDSGPHPGDVR